MESKKTQIKIGKGRLFGLITALFTFAIIFCNWFKVDVWGTSFGYSIFHEKMFDVNTCLGLAKVFAIIALVVGILYIVNFAINFVKFVPGLKKFKFGFNRLFGLVYYGFYTLALLFNIIGCIAEDSITPTVRVIFIFIFLVLIVVAYSIPALSRFANKKFDLVIE